MHTPTTAIWKFDSRAAHVNHLFKQELSTFVTARACQSELPKKKKKKKRQQQRASIFRYKIKMSVHITIPVKQHVSEDST